MTGDGPPLGPAGPPGLDPEHGVVLRPGGALAPYRAAFERLLEWITLALMAALAAIVVVGVGFRKAGAALVWYDEIASILLAWLTFYGASLAALKRAHIGFPKLVDGVRLQLRAPLIVVGEIVTIAFFILVAWSGWQVVTVLQGDYLASLPWLPLRLTQSVIPIGAVLYIIAQLLSLPDVLKGPRRIGGADV